MVYWRVVARRPMGATCGSPSSISNDIWKLARIMYQLNMAFLSACRRGRHDRPNLAHRLKRPKWPKSYRHGILDAAGSREEAWRHRKAKSWSGIMYGERLVLTNKWPRGNLCALGPKLIDGAEHAGYINGDACAAAQRKEGLYK